MSEILENDWRPRKKYVYIGLTGNYALSDFVKEKIINDHKDYIVWDEWDEKQNEWKRSEADDIGRITIFWQDIGGDFDDDPMVIIATYSPANFEVAKSSNNFHQFMLNDDSRFVFYRGKELAIKEAEKEIQEIVNQALASWKNQA